MSKIDNALFEIKQYLNGNDHSDTPTIRQAATVYSTACSNVNNKLAECSRLIRRGLLLDARNIDIEMQPSLTTRAEKLILPAEMSARFEELCKLYGYPVPQSINIAALEQLKKQMVDQEELLEELILRWRKTARTGSNVEKIKILRKIISLTPQDDQIWRSNLLCIEQQWINDLQKESEKAILESDGEKISNIYLALTDPKLQKPTPEKLLTKLQPYVKKYQKQLLDQELDKKRTELFNAYSSQNFDHIASLLREYDILTTNPHYSADKNMENAVAEVRNWLQEETLKRKTEQFHAQKLAELTDLLEKHGDYTRIENIYLSLQKTDIPLDIRISRQVMHRREEYHAELNRKHTRKCIYSVLGAILILFAAGIVFHIIQTARTYSSTQNSMEKLLVAGNNQGVIKLYNHVKQKNPVLLRFGNLNALYLQAEKGVADQQVKELKAKANLNKAEEILQSAAPDLEELKLIQKTIADLQIKQLSPELDSQWQKINFAIHRIEFNIRQQREQTCIRQQKQALQIFAECRKKLTVPDTNPEAVKLQILKAMKNMQELTDKSADISEKFRQSCNQAVQEQGKSLLALVENIIKRRQILTLLTAPESFDQYYQALKQLPSTAPDLAEKEWQHILAKSGQILSLERGTNLAICNSYNEMEKALAELQINLADNCFARDLARILPDKYFNARFKDAVDRLQNDLTALYDCYELTFVDKEKNYWHFYSAEKPLIDKKRSSRIPKALAISVMLTPGTEGEFLPLLVESKSNGTITYVPGKFSAIALPDSFAELKNMSITSASFPKSKQMQLLNKIIRSFNSCTTPEQMTAQTDKYINQLLKDDSMNVFVRAYLLRRLLDIYALASEFHLMAVNKPIFILDNMAKQLYARWYIPSIMAENPSIVKKLNCFFKDFSTEQLKNSVENSVNLHKLALSRGLIPGGIVLESKDKQFKIHWFTPAEASGELWFYQSASATVKQPVGWVALPAQDHVDKKNSLIINHKLQLVHGDVFFVPVDGRSTAELVKQAKQNASKKNIPDMIWPETWPINNR